MAYIVKGDGMPPPPRSQLARADFSRQRDTYVLAKRFRNKDCMRLWSDFASEQPGMARLIVADVEAEDRDRAEVNEKIDKRLRSAEKMVTKTRKAKVTKVRKGRPAEADPDLAAVLLIADPVQRDLEYKHLRGLRG